MRRFLFALCAILALSWFSAIYFAGYYLGFIYAELPSLAAFKNYKPYQTSFILDRNNLIIGCVAEEWRIVLSEEQIEAMLNSEKPTIVKMILAAEDERYFDRKWPIDVQAILRALWKNFLVGRVVEGGSTIEQQTAKQLLSPEERASRTFKRKIKELFLAYKLYKEFGKNTVFAVYVNTIYFGHSQYGIEQASWFYFAKPAHLLSADEAATIAGLIRSPETLSPKKYSKKANERRNTVLMQAKRLGKLSDAEYVQATTQLIKTSDEFAEICNRAPYVTDAAKAVLTKNFLKGKSAVFFDEAKQNPAWQGIIIQTTVDYETQKLAEESVAFALLEYRARLGEKVADAIAAMLVLDNTTGEMLAVVGGESYDENQFNNAIQARRQPGSSFKPIIYAHYIKKLLDNGVPKEQILNYPVLNHPFCCRGATKWKRWCPHNYDPHKNSASFYPLRIALAKSINLCALHAARVDGKKCIMDPGVVVMARALGIDGAVLYEMGNRGQLYFRLPIAIGAADVTLLEMTRAYMVFANRGIFRGTAIVKFVTDRAGMELFSENPTEERRISEDVADIMVLALREVNKTGTGRSLSQLAQKSAGKTGTTNDFSEAWYIGFTPGEHGITVGVWIGGKDKTVSLGSKETGGRVALPVFKKFIEEHCRDKPIEEFPQEQNEHIKNRRE